MGRLAWWIIGIILFLLVLRYIVILFGVLVTLTVLAAFILASLYYGYVKPRNIRK